MTKPTDNPADPFKKALAEATRTMADDPEMTVTYSVDPPGMNKEGVRLPQVSRRMTRDEVLAGARHGGCLCAARASITTRASPRAMRPPASWRATSTTRWRPRAARRWARATCPAPPATSTPRSGMRRIARAMPRSPARRMRPLPVAAGYLVRHLATGRDLPAGARNVMDLWRGFIEEQAGGHAGERRPCAGRSGGLCPAGAQGDCRSRLWRPAGR